MSAPKDDPGLGPLVAFAPRAARAAAGLRRALDVARRDLALEGQWADSEEELLRALDGPPGVLLLLEPCGALHAALAGGWVVVTTARHVDARQGRELLWIASRRESVLLRVLADLLAARGELEPLRRRARALAASMDRATFEDRFAPPLVSVVLATRDDAARASAAVESVLDQTLGDLELVVVDDGSSDATRRTLLSLDDPRLVLGWSPPRGRAPAWNLGLALARGEGYVALLEPGDRWEPALLERLVEALETSPARVGLAYCDTWLAVDGAEPQAVRQRDLDFPGLARGALPPGAFVVRRAAADAAGPFDEELEVGHDHEWLLRLAAGHDLVRVPEPLHHAARSPADLPMVPLGLERYEVAQARAWRAWQRRVLDGAGGRA